MPMNQQYKSRFTNIIIKMKMFEMSYKEEPITNFREIVKVNLKTIQELPVILEISFMIAFRRFSVRIVW